MACLRRCFRGSISGSHLGDEQKKRFIPQSAVGDGETASRRQFLKNAIAIGAATLLPGCRPELKSGSRPRVAIVGAGIAGLSAAHTLAKGGIDSDVYEAGARAGGRILTLRNLVAPGMYTEAGGEFIDTSHEDMLALTREFGLEIQDAFGPGQSNLIDNAWHFGGSLRSEAEVAAAVRDLTAGIQADIGALPDGIVAGTGGLAARLDAMSLEEYLEKRGVTGWLRNLLLAAYVSEFGLDADRQSSLNLLTMVSLDTSEGTFQVFGESDERYRIKGGNQNLTDAMARKYEACIRSQHRLEAIRQIGEGYKLSFQGPGGAVECAADVVILALPFTLLRSVEFDPELPAIKRRVIAELGYGTNSKLFLGFASRPWREAGYGGDFFTDTGIQCGWDHTKVQTGPAAGITLFQGGSAGMGMAQGGPMAQAAATAESLEAVFPGSQAARNGKVGAFHWPSHPLSLGSYACYQPGQWTAFAGEEGKPVGNLHFAGEHCSPDFQGFMNGGAVTGREAAAAVLAKWHGTDSHAKPRG